MTTTHQITDIILKQNQCILVMLMAYDWNIVTTPIYNSTRLDMPCNFHTITITWKKHLMN